MSDTDDFKPGFVRRLLEACNLLNRPYDEARRARASLSRHLDTQEVRSIRHIHPQEALQLLNQRTDLTEESPPSVMEIF